MLIIGQSVAGNFMWVYVWVPTLTEMADQAHL